MYSYFQEIFSYDSGFAKALLWWYLQSIDHAVLGLQEITTARIPATRLLQREVKIYVMRLLPVIGGSIGFGTALTRQRWT